jgi:TP901 family phage tail tape measure protein
MSRFSVETAFKAIDLFSATMRKMQAGTEVFKKSLGGIEKVNDRVFAGLKKVAAVGAVAGGAAVVGFKQVLDAGLEFDSAMVSAGAKFGLAIRKGTDEYKRLQKVAEDVGSTTAFNATQSAGALKSFASAGFNVEQAIAALPRAADFAVAAGIEDLTVAADMATQALGSFNLKTKDAVQLGKNLDRVQDVMAKTADATSASIEGLFEAMKEGGPVAVSAGQSIETFNAIAGRLADAGIEGSVAGTTLKNIFTSFSAPTAEASAQLKKFGVSTKDAGGNMRDALDIFADLEKATKALGTADKTAALETIFGKIPLAGVSALLSGGVEQIRSLRKELDNAAGSTKAFAAVVGDRLAQDLDNLGGSLNGVKVSIFNIAEGPLREITKATTSWIDANKQAIGAEFRDGLRWLQTNLTEIIDTTKSVAKVGAAFIAYAAAVKIASFFVAGAELAVKAYTGAVWLGVKGIAAYKWVTTSATAKDIIATSWTWLKNAATFAYTGTAGNATLATVALTGATDASAVAMTGAAGAAGAANTAMLPLVATVGALVGAFVALYAIWDQLGKLSDETEGLGFLGIAKGMVEQGTWDPFAVVDKHQSDLAKGRKVGDDLELPTAITKDFQLPPGMELPPGVKMPALDAGAMGWAVPPHMQGSDMSPEQLQARTQALAEQTSGAGVRALADDRINRLITALEAHEAKEVEVHVRAEPGTSGAVKNNGIRVSSSGGVVTPGSGR